MKPGEIKQKAASLSLREIAGQKLHHGDGIFINPFDDRVRGFGQILKWKLFDDNPFKPHYADEQVRPVQVDWDAVRARDGLSVTFLKHASILIRDRGVPLIVDPIFGRVAPTITDFTPLSFDPADMPRPEYILITHGHLDHLDLASLKALGNGARAITPLGYEDEFDGLPLRRTQLDWFETVAEDDRKITLLPGNHWTMRSPFKGRNRSLWGGYLIESAAGPVIYVSGDAGWFEGFREIGRMRDIDLAVFNLGAYEPRWFMRQSHMNPEEVLKAFLELGAKRLMIVHWGTFRLGDEPVHFPPRDLARLMEASGLADRLIRLNHGQTVIFEDPDNPMII